MKFSLNKIVFIAGFLAFCGLATGALYAMHLAQHDKDENHSPENCPVCLAINAQMGKLIVNAKPCHIDTAERGLIVIFLYKAFQQSLHRTPLGPRGPPKPALI